ncbi:MAG: hypothetical protein HOF90_00060, partial [Euryarchaeota archaeon]|nr:hypothetical protein [Euryarchaeota archaeon]
MPKSSVDSVVSDETTIDPEEIPSVLEVDLGEVNVENLDTSIDESSLQSMDDAGEDMSGAEGEDDTEGEDASEDVSAGEGMSGAEGEDDT